jgi:hypothetical protein
MPNDTDRGWVKYAAKLRAGHGTLARHGSIEQQVANYRAAYVHGRELEARVREVLLVANVPSISYLFYFAFARRLDRLSRICSGESLRVEAKAYLDYWAARGLAAPVLRSVCAQAFDLAL